MVRKYRRKRRFGQSILIHAPSSFLSMLERKALKYGGYTGDVDSRKYRESQYNHVTGEYVKEKLSSRSKEVGPCTVQRDCYSAFLLYHMETPAKPDRKACGKDFLNFVKCQDKLARRMLEQNVRNHNFDRPELFLAA